MDCYFRFRPDKSCEVICTDCFLTVAVGHDQVRVREAAASHICRSTSKKQNVIAFTQKGQRSQPRSDSANTFLGNFDQAVLPLTFVLFAVFMVFYAIPTVIEFAALRYLSFWLVGILIGDFAGCAGIFLLLKKRITAVVLYLGLTAVECYLYSSHLLSANTLLWTMDIVPTIFIAGAALHRRLGASSLRAA